MNEVFTLQYTNNQLQSLDEVSKHNLENNYY